MDVIVKSDEKKKKQSDIVLVNNAGLYKKCDLGTNLWCLLFGGFVPLFKGDFKISLIYFIPVILSNTFFNEMSAFIVVAGFTIFFIFNYNKMRIKNLLKKGYYPATEDDKQILIKEKIIYS